MRIPEDTRAPRTRHRGRWWIVAAIVVVVLILASLRTLATLWTDELWFSSVDLRSVWVTLLDVKVGLFASFGAVFFVLLWVNLVVCDRLGAPAASLEPEDELVRRYQRVVRPHAGKLYALLALVLALIAASGTIGQWQNWILFTHSVPFGVQDPQFHKDVGFFVFELPFLNFVVDWVLIALAVVTVVVAVFHYLNGGIRPQRAPRVRPAVKAHLSVLVALIAIGKAAGYFLARYQLDLSHNGYVEGAGYTDVHARLPAMWLLFWVSLAAAGILLWNIRRQGWTLPVLAIGVWAFTALVVGVVYPEVLQAIKVNPAQSSKELPYIQRNITATRSAYGLDDVHSTTFPADQTLSPAAVQNNASTLSNVRLWDPQVTTATFQKLQGSGLHGYYRLPNLSVDRYQVDGHLTPAVVAVRQINSNNLPSSSWVNVHLQYTHGEGMVLALANEATSQGLPAFGIENVPPQSSHGLPKVTQPDVYFGLNQSGYVVADTKSGEFDYPKPNGSSVENHYSGTGGVPMSSFLRRAAFAVRLGDFNLLISDLVTSKSRIMFVRDVRAMAEKAAPFLSYDSDPYPVLVNGHIDWVLDAYTTSNQYPYSQSDDSAQLPPGSTLPSGINYVRNSVKVVIDSYSGKMTFYAMDQSDPLLRAYQLAFPKLFEPASMMSSTLAAHLRYPEDIFGVQTAMYGRYHITSPTNFYSAGDAWNLSPTGGSGSPSEAFAAVRTTNAQGQVVTGPIERMSPQYQVESQPGQAGQAGKAGQSGQSLTLTEAFVPTSQDSQSQNLTAFMIADPPRPGHPGTLHAYVIPRHGAPVPGPALVDSEIQGSADVSRRLTLLNQNGSRVLLGNLLMIPVGNSLLYTRPVYVTSSRNSYPQLQDVIAVFGQKVVMEPTVAGALTDVLGQPVSGLNPNSGVAGGSGGGGPISATDLHVEALLKEASADYAAAKKDLAAGNLGGFQTQIEAMNLATQQAQKLLAAAGASSAGSTGSSPGSSTGSGSGSGRGSGGSGSGGSGSFTPSTGSGGGSGASGGGSGSGSSGSGSGSSGSKASRSSGSGSGQSGAGGAGSGGSGGSPGGSGGSSGGSGSGSGGSGVTTTTGLGGTGGGAGPTTSTPATDEAAGKARGGMPRRQGA